MPNTKLKSKWIKGKCKTRNLKSPGRKHRKTLLDAGPGDEFLSDLRSAGNTGKTQQVGPCESKQLLHSQTNEPNPSSLRSGRTYLQTTYLSEHLGLIPEMCKDLIRLRSVKTKRPIKIWTKSPERRFSTEDIQKATGV